MNLDLINERYTDHRYHSYHLLKEHWSSYTDDDKRFIKECENITNSVFPELLQEGPFDRARSKAAGAWQGAKNLGRSLKGRGAEAEDVGQAKLNKRVELFQNSVGKVLGELKRDLGKMGIEGEDHPTIQAMNYIVGSANQIGTEQYPIEVKAGAASRASDWAGAKKDEVLQWTNTKVQELLTKIKAEADKNNTFSGSQKEFDAINKQRAAKMMPPLVKQLRGIKSAGKALQAIEKFGTEHPKWTNFIVGVLVAASRLVGLPGSGILVGLLLRSAVGVIKGEDIQQAVGTAAKVAAVGALAGAAIGEIGDALSDNADQIDGALDQASDAGEDVIRQSPDFDADPNTDFAGGTDEPFGGPDPDSETGLSLPGDVSPAEVKDYGAGIADDIINYQPEPGYSPTPGAIVQNLGPAERESLLQAFATGDSAAAQNAARAKVELWVRAVSDGKIPPERFKDLVVSGLMKAARAGRLN